VESVLLVSKEGLNMGVKSLAEALALAKEATLDLLEVSGNQNPPVCKLVPRKTPPATTSHTHPNSRFPSHPQPELRPGLGLAGKGKGSPSTTTIASPPSPTHQSTSPLTATTTATTASPVEEEELPKKKSLPPKEIKIGLEIGGHDLQVKVNKVKDFLEKGLLVKLTILGRPGKIPNPKAQSSFYESILATHLAGLYSLTRAPKNEGKHLTALIGPAKASK